MKISFKNADHLLDGIRLLTDDLKLALTDESVDITVTVCESRDDSLCISLQGDRASITYGGGKARHHTRHRG